VGSSTLVCNLKDTHVILIKNYFMYKVLVSLYMGKQCVSGCIYYVYVIQYNCQSVYVTYLISYKLMLSTVAACFVTSPRRWGSTRRSLLTMARTSTWSWPSSHASSQPASSTPWSPATGATRSNPIRLGQGCHRSVVVLLVDGWGQNMWSRSPNSTKSRIRHFELIYQTWQEHLI